MDNHLHLILLPRHADGLRATLGEAHRRYTRMINLREGWRGRKALPFGLTNDLILFR